MKGQICYVLWFRGEGEFFLNGVSNTYNSRIWSCLLHEVPDGATAQVRFIPEGNSLYREGYRRAVVENSPTREVPNY